LTWQIEWDERARKELRSLDYQVQKEILLYLRKRVSEDPRIFGRDLVGNRVGLRRYRVGDYRIICRLEDNNLVVLVVAVGHRKEIYD
jgi:mRNA interferase RelE/StbE